MRERKTDGTYAVEHGMTGTRLYHIWCSMNQRCYTPGHNRYQRYGGRGIKVCEEWKRFIPFIVDALKKQLEREGITGQLIHLCFTCDPYPTGYDTSATREVIKAIKASGNHVQILTKGDGSRDFDLLDENDWYGITYDGAAHGVYEPASRVVDLYSAKRCGINTWVSCEPVLNASRILDFLRNCNDFIDKVKIGKLNYYPSSIDWKTFGFAVERLCRELRMDYYIKESLRKEMEG